MRLTLLIFSVFLFGCKESAQTPIEKPQELIILTRVGVTTYSVDATNGAGGFDHDLVQLFAEELGIKSRLVVAASDADIIHRLKTGKGHLAAAWQTPIDDAELRSSSPYFISYNNLITHEASLPLTGVAQLANRTVYVVAGSRQEKALHEIRRKIPGLIIESKPKRSEIELMEAIATHRIEAALLSSAEFDIGNNFYPELQSALEIGPAQPIVWLFAPNTDPELIAKANDFLLRIEQNGTMDRLKDRYFGHIDRLTQTDILRFISRIETVLPHYRAYFQSAQASTGIDWRILAALAYQESHWDERATSPTGVRGMMMLTADTADRLGVTNRLDPAQSIRAGAQYLSSLYEAMPPDIADPDRLWLAIAAYNLGMGHLNAARHIAKTRQANPGSWYEMKQNLPLLAKAQYYKRLKSGKGRGGEAVIMVENIRVYTDILKRHERPFPSFKTTSKHKAAAKTSSARLDDSGATLRR